MTVAIPPPPPACSTPRAALDALALSPSLTLPVVYGGAPASLLHFRAGQCDACCGHDACLAFLLVHASGRAAGVTAKH